jgi:hypothetical protein
MTHRENVIKGLKLQNKKHSLLALARASGIPKSVLQEVYNRGTGAYSSGGIGGNPSPSVRMKGTFKKGINAPASKKLSKEQWSFARTYSFIDSALFGAPKKHDLDLHNMIGK